MGRSWSRSLRNPVIRFSHLADKSDESPHLELLKRRAKDWHTPQSGRVVLW